MASFCERLPAFLLPVRFSAVKPAGFERSSSAERHLACQASNGLWRMTPGCTCRIHLRGAYAKPLHCGKPKTPRRNFVATSSSTYHALQVKRQARAERGKKDTLIKMVKGHLSQPGVIAEGKGLEDVANASGMEASPEGS